MILNLKNDVTVIKKENMKYIDFSMVFPIGEVNVEDSFNFNIMKRLLSNYSIKYPREDYFLEAREIASVYNYSFGSIVRGDTYYGVVYFLIPCEGLIDDFNLKKAFELVYDSLFNSVCKDVKYITDKMYYKEYYKIEEDLNRATGSFNSYCGNEWAKIVDGTGKYISSTEDSLRYLKNNTSKERIVELFDKYITNNYYFTVITGNINDSKYYIDTFNEVFKREEKNFEFETNYYPSYPLNIKGECVQTSTFEQTFLRMQFVNKDYSSKDRYLLMMTNCFLNNNENDLLYKILRGKYNLVYQCYADTFSFFGAFTMTAFLNENNIDKAKNAMLEIIDILKNEDFFKHAKEQLLNADKIALYAMLDNKDKETNNFIDNRLNIDIYETENKELSKITYEDYLNFISKFEVKNTLIIKGVKHD